LVSPEWEPHTPVLRPFVYASKFPARLYNLDIVNRNEYNVSGNQIRIVHKPGTRYYDLWNGVELAPDVRGDSAVVSFSLEPKDTARYSQRRRRYPDSTRIWRRWPRWPGSR